MAAIFRAVEFPPSYCDNGLALGAQDVIEAALDELRCARRSLKLLEW